MNWRSNLNFPRKTLMLATQFTGRWANEVNFCISISWHATFYASLVSTLAMLIHATWIETVSQVLLSLLKKFSQVGGIPFLFNMLASKLAQFIYSCLSRSISTLPMPVPKLPSGIRVVLAMQFGPCTCYTPVMHPYRPHPLSLLL